MIKKMDMDILNMLMVLSTKENFKMILDMDMEK